MTKGKHTDANGFETYEYSKFFCECVTQYLGKEIDPSGKYGLKPNGIYNVYRPKSEIAKKSFIDSLNAKPIMDDHFVIGNGEGFISPDRKTPCGTLSEVKLVGNELRGRIDVWSPSLIRKIHNGKKELSLSYGCDFVPKQGIFNGEKYDFIQSNLRCGNHLAFVDEARNGHDCRVEDGMFVRDEKIQLENPDMDISKLSADEVVEALKGCSDEVRAKCKDFLNLPTEEEKKAANDKAKKEAKDAAANAAEEEAKKKEEADKAAKAEDADADNGKEDKEPDKAVNEDKASDEEQKKIEEDKAKACDAAIKDYQRAIALADDCKEVFGTIAMDGIRSEADVVKHICDMKITEGRALKIQKIISDSKPDCAISALRCALAMVGSQGGGVQSIVKDSATHKKSFAEYMAER